MRRIVIGIVLGLLAGPAWAQPEVDALRVYLGTSGSTCTLHSGSGAPATSLGAVCDVYVRTDSPYTVYSKTGASTWTPLPTMPSGATAGDLITAASATATGRVAAVASGQVLASAGTSTPPAYTASPSLTSIGGAANLTLNPTGDLITAPTGDDILPDTGYTLNIGALTNKYLTLHAAELWVETLVAQNTIATIGGRVLVGPTTTLTSDLASGATSMSVKHNQMANGDRVYLEADGKVEFIAIASAPSGSGPYTYTITRNLDGTGANDWYAGDAVFNTGTTGDGFIDLYSVSAVNGPSVLGPSIVGNVRTGTTYSDIAPRWAIGNLNGVYGYGADTYGAAFGDFANSYLTVDATNGIRMIGDAGTMFSMGTDGNALFAGRLTVGTGRNMLSNTEFRRESSSAFGGSIGSTAATTGPRTGISGTRPSGTGSGSNTFWELGYYSGTGTPTWNWYCNQTNEFPTNGGACAIYAETGTNPSAASVKTALGPAFAAAAGTRFEFSFYADVSAATNVCPGLLFYDSTGTLISSGDSTTQDCVTAAESSGGNDLANWARGYYFATAPTNTRTVVVQVYVTNDGSANPKALITRLFFGEAGAGQTTPTPWAPGGVTLIDGSMLQTDLVVSNTIRSSGATALGTGTGFWLDATGTPTFRVGNPSGNRVEWDGTDLDVVSANVAIDSTGISLTPYVSSNEWNSASAYRWTVSDHSVGLATAYLSGSNITSLKLHNIYSGLSSPAGQLNGISINAYNNTSGEEALIVLQATGTSGNTSVVGVDADEVQIQVSTNGRTWIGAEAYIGGVSGDGSQRIVCIKSDGNLGTCSGSVVAGGTCTCG